MKGFIQLDYARKLNASLQAQMILEDLGVNVLQLKDMANKPTSTVINVLFASLLVEDRKLTKDKLMDLIQKHSNMELASIAMEYVLNKILEWHLGMSLTDYEAKIKAELEAKALEVEQTGEEVKND